MNEELNDVVEKLRANGDRLTGEDGGCSTDGSIRTKSHPLRRCRID